MGRVYRATEIALARPVALKLIADDFAGDRKFRERFQRESMLAASIDHPNVIPIYEAGEVDGELYIAMRFVDGTDLLAAVVREGPLEPAARRGDHHPGRVGARRRPPPRARPPRRQARQRAAHGRGRARVPDRLRARQDAHRRGARHDDRGPLRRHARLLLARGDPGRRRRRALGRLLARLRPLLRAHARLAVPARLERRDDVRPRQRAAAVAARGAAGPPARARRRDRALARQGPRRAPADRGRVRPRGPGGARRRRPPAAPRAGDAHRRRAAGASRRARREADRAPAARRSARVCSGSSCPRSSCSA